MVPIVFIDKVAVTSDIPETSGVERKKLWIQDSCFQQVKINIKKASKKVCKKA
jgi:hypothetical protein